MVEESRKANQNKKRAYPKKKVAKQVALQVTSQKDAPQDEVPPVYAIQRITQEQASAFFYNSIDLFNRHLSGSYHAVKIRADKEHEGDAAKIPLDAEMISLINHVTLISIAMEPIQKEVAEDLPEYADLYKWMKSIHNLHGVLEKKFAAEKKKEN